MPRYLLPRFKLRLARRALAAFRVFLAHTVVAGTRTAFGVLLAGGSRSCDVEKAKAVAKKLYLLGRSGEAPEPTWPTSFALLWLFFYWVTHDTRSELAHLIRFHLGRLFDFDPVSEDSEFKSGIKAALNLEELAQRSADCNLLTLLLLAGLGQSGSRSRRQSALGATIHHFQATA